MINQSTVDILKTMRFSAMASAFEKQMSEPSAYGQLGFEERFGFLADAEWYRRQTNKLNRCIVGVFVISRTRAHAASSRFAP